MARQSARLPAPQVNDDEGADDTPEPTLREQILAARDEVNAAHGEGGEPGGASGEGEAARTRQDDQAGRGDGRGTAQRDLSGRFQRGAAPAAAPAGRAAPAAAAGAQPGAQQGPAGAAQPAAGAPPGAQQGPAGAAGAQPRADVAPTQWSREAQALWQQLPERARQEIVKREADIQRFASTMDQERSTGREFATIAQNYQDVIGNSGVHPLRYFDDVLRIMRVMTQGTLQQKVEMLRGVAMRQGVDFRALLAPQAGGQPQPGAAPGAAPAPSPQQPNYPPELVELIRWNQNFRRSQEELAARQAREAEDSRRHMAQEVMTEIEAFRARPESEFFDQVRDHMTVLLANGLAKDLQEAYDQAIYSRPDIRAVLDQRAAEQARTQAASRARVQAARARGGSLRGGTGGSRPPPGPGDRSVREELQAAFAEHAGRV